MTMGKKMIQKGRKGTLLSVFIFTVFAFLVLPFGQAFGLVVDNFEGAQNFSTNTAGTTTDSFSGANIIGGTREGSLTLLSGNGNSLRASTTPGGSGFNLYTFSEDSGVNGTGLVTWRTNIPYDLTDGGSQTSFLFRWVMNDHPINVTFTVTGGGSAAHTFVLDGNSPIQNQEVAFSSFAGVDMTNVTQIQISIPQGGQFENDFSIGPITTQGVAVTCNKTFSESVVAAGDVITATVTLTATGTGAATVNVMDSLDAGLLYEATGTANPPDSVSADLRTLNWTGVVVNVETPVTLKYNVLVDAITPGQELCNNVQVTANPGGTLLTQCRACVQASAQVPTFTEWGLMVLALVFLGTAVRFFRRRSIS